MSEIYWITRLDCLVGFFNVVLLLGIIIFICLGIALFITYNVDDAYKSFVKFIKLTSLIILLSVIGVIFTPTTKEALLIFGIGSTIDHIQTNDTLKELPDKCVKALDAWVDSFLEEGNKK